MCVKVDWDTELNEPFTLFELPEGDKASTWEILEPGFHELSYSNEELSEVGELSILADHSDDSSHGMSNLLICNEAVESPENSISSSDIAILLIIIK